MVFDPREPHDGLPLLPPAIELETRAVLKQCLGATRALAELKGAGGLIPDQTILINSIPLQEAKLSLGDREHRYHGGEVLLEMLDNLEVFMLAEEGPDPLVRMAVAHYQFEAIHPFTDGNGRTGRILNLLYLIHARLLEIPVLYLSRFIIQNKAEYYRLLRSVTETGAWEEWLLYMLRGVQETALWTTNRIRAIRDLFDATVGQTRRELPRIYSKELIEMIFRQPYCKIQFLVDAGIAKRQTASVYLQELERIGLLTSERRGKEVIYKHPALLEVLIA